MERKHMGQVIRQGGRLMLPRPELFHYMPEMLELAAKKARGEEIGPEVADLGERYGMTPAEVLSTFPPPFYPLA